MVGLKLAYYHLETLWAQNPKAVFKFLEALQAHAYLELGYAGSSRSSVRIMFRFARPALSSRTSMGQKALDIFCPRR